VRELVKRVDDFFASFIEDEVGRAFFLHLPFWGISLFLAWCLMGEFGLYLLWAAIVFVVVPFSVAAGYREIYEHDGYQRHAGKWTAFRASLALYAVAVLALIGVPGWYQGLLMRAIESDAFTKAYWWAVVHWWQVFNFYREDELKELQAFANRLRFSYAIWQWSFFASAAIVAPAFFFWFCAIAKDLAKQEKIEAARRESEAMEAKRRADARAREMAEYSQREEKRRNEELEAKMEERRKIEAKVNEVRGKDPWESGFL
jgi:hypothetical protein